jgi:peptidyl-prolyl cis-trans isomerase SurA
MRGRAALLLALLLALGLMPGTVGARAEPRPPPERLDGIAALVDGVPIFRSVLARRVAPVLALRRAEKPLGSLEEMKLGREVLEQMIDETLIAVDAGRIGIVATEAELAAAIAMVKQMSGIDAAQLEAEVARSGLSFLEYEDLLRQQILEQKWIIYHTSGMDTYLFADAAGFNEAYAAERQRLVSGLRERSFIEVRW